MALDFNDDKPIYIQLGAMIEDMILTGNLKEGEQVPSTTEISTVYKVNPATALKGINLLVADGIIYKKRGMGMFVQEGAREIIKEKKKQEFCGEFIQQTIETAKKLDIKKEDIIKMITENWN